MKSLSLLRRFRNLGALVGTAALFAASPSLAEPPGSVLEKERAALAAAPKDHPTRLALLRTLVGEARLRPPGPSRQPLLDEASQALRSRPATGTQVEQVQYGRLAAELARLRTGPTPPATKSLLTLLGSSKGSRIESVFGPRPGETTAEGLGAGGLLGSGGLGSRGYGSGGGALGLGSRGSGLGEGSARGYGGLGTLGGPREQPPIPPDGPQPRLSIEPVVGAGPLQVAVDKVLQDQTPRLRACYEEAVRRRADAAGSVEWRGTLSAAGQLLRGATTGTLGDEAARTCMARALESGAFPVGSSDHAVVVRVRGEVVR